MHERAPEAGFVPFIPRRVACASGPQEQRAVGEVQIEPPRSEQPVLTSESQECSPAPSEPVVRPEPPPTTQHPEGEPAQLESVGKLKPIVCEHGQLIRNEAIRLAAIACGRALRHVAFVHPQALASFVDDALAAAGRPTHHSISSHLNDDTLEFGEVVIQCDESRVSADIETRAELLVRAAAES